ncbi:hypothetical protein NDU88_008797 [Pleurodeles waltl]|uniref:Uncharacterized protein n=1 Tax=Pleurodeles waltl TaxID=8319 RepID=A0AAV7QVP6_PLEWA|nr:hypothetical protein NDU88_008797 [Pleurodeles waltl]
MEANKVVQALRVLPEAGREDLIKEGVLEQAWVGLKRPKRSSAERDSTAVFACKSPESSPRRFKKFKAKSFSGRKVSVSPERERAEMEELQFVGLPGVASVRGSGARFPRRSGASLRHQVAAASRGAVLVKAHSGAGQTLVRGTRARAQFKARRPQAATSACGQLGEFDVHAGVSKHACAHKGAAQQAPLTVESGGECCASVSEERQLGGAANMAVPSEIAVPDIVGAGNGQLEDGQRIFAGQVFDDVIIIDSEEEGELVEVPGEGGRGSNRQVGMGLVVQSGRFVQRLPKVSTSLVHRVQEWDVANQSVFRAGEQVVFRDEQGLVLKGTICGVSSEDGSAGSALVRLDFWNQEPRAYLSGCEAPHVSSGHEVTSVHQRLGRPAGGQVPVGVRAPPGHRPEERAQPGVVRLTSRDLASLEGRSLDPILNVRESRLDSWSAMSGIIEEEELDYEEETLGAGEQVVAVPQASTSGQAFQGDRLSGRREVAANLCRGEVSDTYDGGLAIGGGTRTVVRSIKNVDVAIQAGEGVKESKSEGSMGIVQEVAGESGVDQLCRWKASLVGVGGFAHKAVGGGRDDAERLSEPRPEFTSYHSGLLALRAALVLSGVCCSPAGEFDRLKSCFSKEALLGTLWPLH